MATRATRKLAHYTLLEPLGTGAMASVWLGRDEQLDMNVAIKVLSPKILSDPGNLARFEQEARAAANLRHPNIAHVFFIGRTEENLPFYAMEYIDGVSLADVVDQRMSFTGSQVLAILIQAARALQCASENKILHRDVKPSNIMIAKRGAVKLVDFGLAKFYGGDLNITRPGVAVGTPAYLSPELAQGEPGDFRADMYSLGISAYELLAGQPPFRADSPMNVLVKHVQDPLPALQGFCPRAPRELSRILERMLAKLPDERYPSYAALIADFMRLAEARPDFLATRYAKCAGCGKVEPLDRDGQCLGCNPKGAERASEELYGVAITQFNDQTAKRRVHEWMMRTTNRPPEVVTRLLDNVPVLLASRLQNDMAKRLLAKIEFMGAKAELRASGMRVLRTDDPHKPLEAENLRDLQNASTLPMAATDAQVRSSYGLRLLQGPWALLFAVALLLGSLSAVVYSLYITPSFAPQADEGHWTLEKRAPLLIKPTVVTMGPLDPWVVQALQGQLTNQLRELCPLFGLYPEQPLVWVLDALSPFSDTKDAAGLIPLLGGASSARLPLGGLSATDTSLSAILRSQAAFALLSTKDAERLPIWLKVGLAVVIGGLRLPEAWPENGLVELSAALEAREPSAVMAAAGLVDALKTRFGKEKLLAFTKRLRAGENPDTAAVAVFGRSLAALLAEKPKGR